MVSKRASTAISKIHSVESRFRNLIILLFVLIVFVLIMVVNYVIGSITEAASEDYASFYSLEAVNKLNIYLNREVGLVTSIAGLDSFIDWFSDESNIEKKTAAYNEIINYTETLFNSNLYFVIADSLNEYSIDKGASLNEFIPFDVIRPDIEYNQWYYRCISSKNNYTLNIDIDKVSNQRRLWINYKVVHNGKVLGVFCSSFRFDEVIVEIFSQYDKGSVRGAVINEYGAVQMDSTLTKEEDLEVYEKSFQVQEMSGDHVFLTSIEEYLSKIDDNYFTAWDKPIVLKLHKSKYSYSSLTPIANTNWSVVTFFDSESLFNTSKLWSLMLAILFALILYAIIVAFLSRKLIFIPLCKLTDSIDRTGARESEKIYGYDLQNEFGEVSRTVQNMRGRIAIQASMLQTIFDSIPDFLFSKDLNSAFTQCNVVMENYFSRKKEDIIGRNNYNGFGFPVSLAEKITESDRKVISEGKQFTTEEWLPASDGSERLFEIVKSPLKQDGVVVGLIGIARDITERKAMEEAAQTASQSKSVFLANMSHELRTPLNVVIGLTDLTLEESNLPEHISENLYKIGSAGGTLLSIVNDILDFSKIEAGKLNLIPADYYLPGLLNDVITLITTRLKENPIKFILNISEELPCRLYGDDLRVKQIFNNLLSNAFKYTHTGTIELTVNSVIDGEKDVWLEITVKDTGVGIREEDLRKIFLDYSQVEAQTNRKIEGTGLGLSITKRLVEMMDGEITVESDYGKGSVFRVSIRQEFIDKTPIGPKIAENLCGFRCTKDKRVISQKLVRPDLSYARVLVVDDMQTNLDVAEGLLLKYKLGVDCLTSGQEAVERIREGQPVYNAVFIDHMMPEMNGIEAADAIRAIDTEYARKIPIIALTANAIQGTESVFYAHGFQAFLTKPIDIMLLNSIICKWIRNENKESPLDTLNSGDTYENYLM